MRVFKTLLIILFSLFILFWVLAFTHRNAMSVPLDLVALQLPEQSVAVWVLLAFVLGGIAGLLFSTALYMRVKKNELSLCRQLRMAEEELKKLRLSAFKS